MSQYATFAPLYGFIDKEAAAGVEINVKKKSKSVTKTEEAGKRISFSHYIERLLVFGC